MPGPIQNAINQASATVAGAAVGVKHMQEKAALAEEQGLLAKEQYHEAGADLKQLEGEKEAAKEGLGSAEADLAVLNAKKPGGKGNTKEALDEKRKAKMSEVEAAQRAFDELQDRIEAKLAMQSRAEKIMKKTNTWGGVR